MLISYTHKNYKNLSAKERFSAILDRASKREIYFALATKMLAVAKFRNIQIVMENPWSEQNFLKTNFLFKPTFVDKNRRLRGDYFIKPTAYWFLNCEPTHGITLQKPKEEKRIEHSNPSGQAGICSEERSMISPDYARNFINDFILGRTSEYSQLTLF